jgi:hypothetical protein
MIFDVITYVEDGDWFTLVLMLGHSQASQASQAFTKEMRHD